MKSLQEVYDNLIEQANKLELCSFTFDHDGKSHIVTWGEKGWSQPIIIHKFSNNE